MKHEATLKSAAMRELHRQCPDFLILRLADAGGPDRVIVGEGRSTYWEFKHATPGFISHGNQELFCARLAVVSSMCRYVIWQEHQGVERTLIVHPRILLVRQGWDLQPEAWCPGFDHRWLVEQIKKAHNV